MLVRVVKSFSLSGKYNPGDIAGFPDAVAERLVRQGFATPHQTEHREQEPEQSGPARVIKADVDAEPQAKHKRRRRVKG